MAFVERRIDVTIALGKGNFGNSGFNRVKLTNLRVSCQIQRNGMPGMEMASVKIFGISLSLMNQLSQLGTSSINLRNNRLLIEAGDDDAGMSTAFNGVISSAQASIPNQPEASLQVEAHNGLLEALKPALPTSYQGSADAADIIANLAKRMGLGFENNGVSVMLSTPYLHGSLRQQLLTCIQAAGIYGYIDDVKQVVAIWPRFGSREASGSIPLISPETGLVGYPSFRDFYINLRTVYNPALAIAYHMQVKSSVTLANDRWLISQITHTLESQVPGGAWFSDVQGNNFGSTGGLTVPLNPS